MSKVIFSNVSHTYLKNTPIEARALIDVDLAFEAGKFHTIIGHTGSGKSTLIQHINGLKKATKGEVVVDGYKIKNTSRSQKQLKEIRKKASIVFQFPELQLFAESVEKDIMFGPMRFGASEKEAKALAKKYIQIVGLSPDILKRTPFELSGGQKRRVAIAGILAIQPEVLIIDEPTVGLDPVGKAQIMDIFSRLNKKGLTIILITHNMDDVWKYTDIVTVMEGGKVKFNGTPKSLFQNKEILKQNAISLPKHIKFIHEIKKQTGINVPIDFDNPKDIVKYLKQVKGGS